MHNVIICLPRIQYNNQSIEYFQGTYMNVPLVLGVHTLTYVQLWPLALIRLLDKPYENEVTLRGQKPP